VIGIGPVGTRHDLIQIPLLAGIIGAAVLVVGVGLIFAFT
jgi:hypothetical protein